MSTVSPDRGRRRLAASTAAVLAIAGVLLLGFAFRSATTAIAPPTTVTATPAPPSGAATAPDRSAGRHAMPGSVPVRVDIARIGAHSSLVPLGLNADGTIAVPSVHDPMQAGWYSYGPTPGEVGPAVILGHVDGDGREGIFFRLSELSVGDRVQVTRTDGSTATFRVTRVTEVAKDSFPTAAVYGATPDAELRLITCGGSFDRARHSYRDNIIVYATLL